MNTLNHRIKDQVNNLSNRGLIHKEKHNMKILDHALIEKMVVALERQIDEEMANNEVLSMLEDGECLGQLLKDFDTQSDESVEAVEIVYNRYA